MSSSLKIQVLNEYLDINKETNVAFSLQAFNFLTPQFLRGNFSTSFTIPLTPKNIRILKYVNEININATFEQIQCSVFFDDVEIFPFAVIRIESISRRDAKIRIFSGNFNILQALQDKFITDLNIPGASFILDSNKARQLFDSDVFGLNRDIIYLHYNKELFSRREVYQNEVFASLRLGFIFRKIIEQAGFNFSGISQDILNDIDSIYLLPTESNSYMRQLSSGVCVANRREALTSPFNLLADIEKEGSTESGLYIRNSSSTLVTVEAGVEAQINISVSYFKSNLLSGSITLELINFGDGSVIESSTSSSNINSGLLNISLIVKPTQNTSYAFRITRTPANFLFIVANISISALIITPRAQYNVLETFGSISQLDIFKQVVNLYGLSCVLDEYTNTLKFFNFNDVVGPNIQKAINITNKVDIESIEIREDINTLAQKNLFLWNEVRDSQGQKIEKEEEAAAFFSINNTALPVKSQILKLFANQYGTIDGVITLKFQELIAGGESRSWPLRSYSNQKTSLVKIRPGLETLGLYRSINSLVNFSVFPNSVAVAQNINLQSYVNIYYAGYIQTCRALKIVECTAYLDVLDFLNIDFSKPVFIDYLNAYFYINKIENLRLGGACKLQLIKI